MESSSMKSFDPEMEVAGFRRSCSSNVIQSSSIPPVSVSPVSSDVDDNQIDQDQASNHPSKEIGPNKNTSKLEGKIERNKNVEVKQEPIEHNVSASRTPSVEYDVKLPSCPSQPNREVVDTSSEVHETGSHASNGNVVISTTSSSRYASVISNSLYEYRDFDDEIERAREIGSHYLMDHTIGFLERRRRIRSERGSRNNQDLHDVRNIMHGMSRNAYMAEALFEVMDGMHDQSLSLLSRPSLSLTVSVPAPCEVVQALPVKPYRKVPNKLNEGDAQCYICLVEYEDGDEVRVLPCRHEFHKLCIDKWLKKVQRVCPVCRDDVCKSSSSRVEGR